MMSVQIIGTFIILWAGIVFGSLWKTDDFSVQIMLVIITVLLVAFVIGLQVKKQNDTNCYIDTMKKQLSKLDERLTKIENKQNTK